MGKFKFKFIDLFSGIGGFHQAMRYLGGKCVMASEIDEDCINTYQKNFTIDKMLGDIRQIDTSQIPEFDVLCAGFPCQPFSKAGGQEGFRDDKRGNLFYVILDILDNHPEVKFIILENVRNLADRLENWDVIRSELMSRNFFITEDPIILSPSDFGIPQVRERVYILGLRKDVRDNDVLKNGYIHREDLKLDEFYQKCKIGDAFKILEKDIPNNYLVSSEEESIIIAWDEFRMNVDLRLARPIWVQYFGVNNSVDAEFYQIVNLDKMPDWKKVIVRRNRELYKINKVFINKWIEKYNILAQNKLFQKFEWNCGIETLSMRNTIIQIRQSGIRVKRSNFYPALVAMVNTPIIWDDNQNSYRRITPREAANIQSFNKRFKFVGSEKQIYKQLGNSVNVRILKILGNSLFKLGVWGAENEQENKY